MRTTKAKTPQRRTQLELSKLTHEQVKADLIAVGLKPCVIVQMPVDGSPLGRPREPHERLSWEEHDKVHQDEWLEGRVKHVNPEAIDKMELHSFELERYVETLSQRTILTLFESVQTYCDRHPGREWRVADYRKELAGRLARIDHEDYKKTAEPPTPPKKEKKTHGKQTRQVRRSIG